MHIIVMVWATSTILNVIAECSGQVNMCIHTYCYFCEHMLAFSFSTCICRMNAWKLAKLSYLASHRYIIHINSPPPLGPIPPSRGSLVNKREKPGDGMMTKS